ncbi:MAG: DUF1206 domain-containing protein [Acidobacteriota bacterium]
MNGQEKNKQIKEKVKEKVREARPWVVLMGRIGFAAMGVVHLLVGILAIMSVVGIASASGTEGALQEIVQLPFGQFLLVAVAVGFVGYAVWRFIQAMMDTDAKGSDVRGIAVRFVYAGIGLVYLGLSFSAVKIFLGAREDEGIWAQSWTAWLLAQPFGQWFVGLAAAITAIIGVVHFYIAYKTKFRENWQLSEMSKSQEKWGTRFGIVGFSARGIVFCIIGFFLAFAAWQSNAGRVRDFGGALRSVEHQPYGIWLLGLVAAGLFSYGIFMFFQVRFRRIVKTL